MNKFLKTQFKKHIFIFYFMFFIFSWKWISFHENRAYVISRNDLGRDNWTFFFFLIIFSIIHINDFESNIFCIQIWWNKNPSMRIINNCKNREMSFGILVSSIFDHQLQNRPLFFKIRSHRDISELYVMISVYFRFLLMIGICIDIWTKTESNFSREDEIEDENMHVACSNFLMHWIIQLCVSCKFVISTRKCDSEIFI